MLTIVKHTQARHIERIVDQGQHSDQIWILEYLWQLAILKPIIWTTLDFRAELNFSLIIA